jgi:hypothetical protein
MLALRLPAPPVLSAAATMQGGAAAAANAAAHQQLNAAALATMLVHGPPGQPYAPAALAQLLAFTAGQPAWQAQAQFAGNGNLDRGGVSAPPTSDERAGPGRTNYAARHQVRGATYIHNASTAVVPPDPPRHTLPHRVPRCSADARARRPVRRQLRSGGETASTTGCRR